jgi:LysM repeat protein
MLKYSTYRSIYDETPEAKSASYHSASGSMTLLKELTGRIVEAIVSLSRQANFVKFALVILLVVSGFTVVGNVFAGPLSLMKQEKRVVVERGDTLWSIALKNKPTDMRTAAYIEGIKISSGLEDSNIQAGDVITLPIY